MTGKQHVAIGTTLGVVGTYVYLGGNLSPSNITTYLTPITIGTIIGAWGPDIDSKKSYASQIFNKVLLAVIIGLVGANYIHVPALDKVLGFAKDGFIGNVGMILFVANLILGKLSSHRQYTHRWLGTLVACVSAYMAFAPYVAIGYIVGYASHILADRTTAAGKNLKFYRFQLPMTNSKGEFHVSL